MKRRTEIACGIVSQLLYEARNEEIVLAMHFYCG